MLGWSSGVERSATVVVVLWTTLTMKDERFTSSPFYLVDPASGICSTERLKPCKCKYSIALFTRLRTAHYTSYNLHDDRVSDSLFG